MSDFFSRWHIKHITGIPYNPQGQATVERNHQCLKEQLLKQKGGISPYIQLQMALFTINILNFSKGSIESKFQRHWGQLNPRLQVQVKWKDPLTQQWRGPDPLITIGRGFGCIFPIGETAPIWLPARNLKFLPISYIQEDAQKQNDQQGEKTIMVVTAHFQRKKDQKSNY